MKETGLQYLGSDVFEDVLEFACMLAGLCLFLGLAQETLDVERSQLTGQWMRKSFPDAWCC